MKLAIDLLELPRVAAAKLWSSVQQLQEQIQVAKNLDVMSKKPKEEKPPAYVVYIGDLLPS